jgi:hypothetical protein
MALKRAQTSFEGFQHRFRQFRHFCRMVARLQPRNYGLLAGDMALHFGNMPISLNKVPALLIVHPLAFSFKPRMSIPGLDQHNRRRRIVPSL